MKYPQKCSGSNRRCSNSSWARREFLKTVGAGAGLMALHPWQAMAGPFTRADFEKLVPADKKLRPEWVKSLTERGERTVYRGADLEKIGMPIGGICTGQVYLGGDGKLWHWDIFNHVPSTGADHYAHPLQPSAPFEQGFAVRVTAGDRVQTRVLDRTGWRDVSFIGEYPIGFVDYRDPECPASVHLEAFSPFIPLATNDSSIPATIFEFTLKNESQLPIEVDLAGWLENPVCLYSGQSREVLRMNAVGRTKEAIFLQCDANPTSASVSGRRPDIRFADFEAETYGDWTVAGKAFGTGPAEMARIPEYQDDVGGKGKRVLNSHASAPGSTVGERDAATGTLTSPPFTIERNYISFLIGGGNHPGKTCMNLLVEGKVVRTATGHDSNRMRQASWRVDTWTGKTARLQIVDLESGPWGNIGIDQIVFSDYEPRPARIFAAEPDNGGIALAILDHGPDDFNTAVCRPEGLPGSVFPGDQPREPVGRTELGQKLIGAIGRKLRIPAGATAKATFILAWFFPNLELDRLVAGRHYNLRLGSVIGVVLHAARNFERLSRQTHLWHHTWYDSTLPYWFLDRTFLNTSILATSTCCRLEDGRFYAWEGVGCCPGTCGHVWHYAHALARLFPELERATRENVDFGLALQPDGAIHFRGEFNDFPAIDAQAGCILRAWREHQMSADAAFLKRTWPKIRRATEWLIAKDENGDGLIESNQHNTLDTDWFGPVAWLSGLYLAALLAAETMAKEANDEPFAAKCRAIFDAGRKNLVARLFEGEYFINRPDPRHLDAINSGSGCEIDQVFGQSWAFQVGLARVLPENETRSALKSLWRYNFTPDVGPYRRAYKPGRWYAMPGEAGLLMCTFPRADWDYAQAKGKGPEWAAGYFNECMNGFEYQVAGHMLWEGLVTEGLAITRAVHDRYHASRRNPWNEVECGDHYARSMASYGVFLAACGFEHHGPNGHLGFAPRLFAHNAGGGTRFRCAFTSAEGWGTFEQKTDLHGGEATITLKWGRLRLRTLALQMPPGYRPGSIAVTVNGGRAECRPAQSGERLSLTLADEAIITAEHDIRVQLG